MNGVVASTFVGHIVIEYKVYRINKSNEKNGSMNYQMKYHKMSEVWDKAIMLNIASFLIMRWTIYLEM